MEGEGGEGKGEKERGKGGGGEGMVRGGGRVARLAPPELFSWRRRWLTSVMMGIIVDVNETKIPEFKMADGRQPN